MTDATNQHLEQIVHELREMRRMLEAIRADFAPFVEERATARRMQSPLMGVDLFHGDTDRND